MVNLFGQKPKRKPCFEFDSELEEFCVWKVFDRGAVLENTFWSPWPWARRSSPWPRSLKSSKIALFFEPLKFCWKKPKVLRKICEDLFYFPLLEIASKFFWRPFFWRSPEKIFWNFWRTVAPVSMVLGLEHSCPWPRIFFLSLALASSRVSSTPPLVFKSTCRM